MSKFKVAVVVGSNRRESINRKLAQAIARLADGRVAAKFVQIDDLQPTGAGHRGKNRQRREPTQQRARAEGRSAEDHGRAQDDPVHATRHQRCLARVFACRE